MNDEELVRMRVLQSAAAAKNRVRAGDEKWARSFARDAVSWARILTRSFREVHASEFYEQKTPGR